MKYTPGQFSSTGLSHQQQAEIDKRKAREKLEAAAPDLFTACKYAKVLLCDNIGQKTHAIAMLELAIDLATK
jgi:hypothetical protein